jgi:hypothetical protein
MSFLLARAEQCIRLGAPKTQELLRLANQFATNQTWLPLLCMLFLHETHGSTSFRILRILRNLPEEYNSDLQTTLLRIAWDPMTPTVAQEILRLYHKVCHSPDDLARLIKEGRWERYVGNARIAKDFIDLYMNPRMCLAMQTSSEPFAIALNSTKQMRTYYNRLVFQASTKICRFIEHTYHRIYVQKAKLRHAFATLAIRWRWRQAWLLRQACIVCWESGLRLRALHGDWRHSICLTCLEQVDRCPLCRTTIRAADNDNRTRTASHASSISYTTDYEDPYYDDDQDYHY